MPIRLVKKSATNTEETMVIILPIVVIGYKSPYPTVVSDIVAQYTASKNVLKVSGSTL